MPPRRTPSSAAAPGAPGANPNLTTASGAPAARKPFPGVPIGPRAAAVLKLAYRANRAALLEGPTGIGKSELVQQVAAELGIGFKVLDLSLLEPPDLVGLPVIADGRTSYATPSALPTAGAGILLLEELNRADRTVQQPALQLLTARKLHEYELPPGWVPFAAINPEDGEYQVTPLDPALRCRFLQLKVCADIRAWRTWAAAHCPGRAVTKLAAQHDDLLDLVPPRTWFYVAQLVSALSDEEKGDEPFLNDALGGYLPAAWVRRLRDELTREVEEADTADSEVLPLLARYHTDGSLRASLVAARDAGHTDRFHRLARRLLDIVDSAELLRLIDARAFNLDAFDALLADLPGDFRAGVQRAIGGQPAAARLLALTPEQVADPQYATSARRADVAGWVNDPFKRHRAVLLSSAVIRWLDAQSPTDLNTLRANRGRVSGLLAFRDQVGAVAPAFARELAKHGIG
jgi:hypothetical protein